MEPLNTCACGLDDRVPCDEHAWQDAARTFARHRGDGHPWCNECWELLKDLKHLWPVTPK